MHSGEVTALKWKPFECPYCHVTFEKEWATAHFRPYPTFASVYKIRWAACSVCANPIITLEDEAGTAVYCDIDFFKAVNDAHGHPTGDEVLRAYGSLVDKRMRGKGTLYRIGGEEFAILLPRFERDVAAAQAESLRKHIEAARLANDSGGRPLKITSSFGVAAFPEDASNPTDLARKADAALYLAKQGGRNRVACP